MKTISMAVLVSIAFVNCAAAQGDFFFSFLEGGVNGNQEADFLLGDTGSLYIYWSTNGPADSDLSVGAFIDVFTDVSGVIEFTAAETFDYQIDAGGTPVGHRLLDDIGGGGSIGGPANLDANFIDELAAFTVTGGPGILENHNGSGVIFDHGYDAANDGFNWGRIDFLVVGDVGDTVNITGAAGDGMIVNGSEVVPAVFTTATVNVISDALIPEPSTTGLLIAALAGIAVRRRPARI